MKVDKALRDATRRNYEGLKNSRTFLLIFSEKMVDDVIPIIQMGLAVYLDKPILILAPKGSLIPHNLRAMAQAVEEFDPDDPESLETATKWLQSRGLL